MSLRYVYKSLDGTFPRKLTPHSDRQYGPFKKTWSQILDLLERELRLISYRDGSCVMMTGHRPRDLRYDGMLRSSVPQPEHPGVVIKFDVWDITKKRYVPMSFECDSFVKFEANVQAIASAMESLRRIDRYAVTGGGRSKAHYEGYKALPSAEGKETTRESAAAFMAKHSGVAMTEILFSDTARATAYRKAAQTLHPDRGGNQEEFVKLAEANKVLTTIVSASAGASA